ncbi:MAG: hypothetical protein K2X74_14590, partial [Acetobacteraceae bacterium]|nr:hypothetical protein [Acetobacteraceae bacterium]
MPQHDLDLVNASGASLRGDLNNALVALGTTMKGPAAPSPARAGMLWIDDDTPSATIWTLRAYDGTDWLDVLTIDTVNNTVGLANAPMTPGFRNRLLNGGMEIWQRGTSLAVAAASAGYTVDRWALQTGAGASCTVSRQAGLSNASRYCARVQRDSGQSGTADMVFEQPFTTEDVVQMRGRKLSLTFDARRGGNYSGAGNNLQVRVYAGTGTEARRGGTPYAGESTLLTTAAALATTAGTFTFTTTA